MANTRCVYCNWLNQEVGISFVCKNCKEDNNATMFEEPVKDRPKEDTQYNTKRRAK